MVVVVTTGAVRRAKFVSNHHHQETNTQLFTGRMPFNNLILWKGHWVYKVPSPFRELLCL